STSGRAATCTGCSWASPARRPRSPVEPNVKKACAAGDLWYVRAAVHDYGFFSYESKADFLRRSEEFWNPDKTRFWQDAGVDLVIDRREGYLFWDMAGRRLIDLHLNGGTYNLGHRNPELIAVLEQAMGRFDIGNHP